MASEIFEPIIGLEIHAQLLTESKIFCSCSAQFGGGDNENICPVCMGMPGTLPVLNEKVVEFAVKTGIALNCTICKDSLFARKNYFYPDLPKGYQISQYDRPLCSDGCVEFFVDDELKRVRVTRAHLEEDAGKSIHDASSSLVNLNRSGVPLLEIVSAPELKSPREASEYAKEVRRILRYTHVCDGNLEEGSLRCDCNVSVRRKGESTLGTKVEIKNLNSFRFIEKALNYEIERQIDCLTHGRKIIQETRLYDSEKNRTESMRSKEEAQDYRYFPDPDLLCISIDDDQIGAQRKTIPELPSQRIVRWRSQFDLSHMDAALLADERDRGDYFQETVNRCGNPKAAANWIMVEVMGKLNDEKKDLKDLKFAPSLLGELIQLIDSKRISGRIAKDIFKKMWETGESPTQIMEKFQLNQLTDDTQIREMIQRVLFAHPTEIEEYRRGKIKVLGFFVGRIMKESKGLADPQMVQKILMEQLDEGTKGTCE